MQDRELYRRILGIESPWQVERVELKLESAEIHVYLEHAPEANWLCPECSAPSPLYDQPAGGIWTLANTKLSVRASTPAIGTKARVIPVIALSAPAIFRKRSPGV